MRLTNENSLLTTSPTDITSLLSRCAAIEGQNLGVLTQKFKTRLPQHLLYEKGSIGQFIEYILGASAGCRPEPDFPELGIELKTIPVNEQYVPQESTYICTTQVDAKVTDWIQSTVYKKTRHILWVPIITTQGKPITNRIIGQCLLWQPSLSQHETIKADWEELMEMVYLGQIDQINASYGEYLHIRPKAAHSRILFSTTNLDGTEIQAGPKGFYFRTSFTRQILTRQ